MSTTKGSVEWGEGWDKFLDGDNPPAFVSPPGHDDGQDDTGAGTSTSTVSEPLTSEEWAAAVAKAEKEGKWEEAFILKAQSLPTELEDAPDKVQDDDEDDNDDEEDIDTDDNSDEANFRRLLASPVQDDNDNDDVEAA